MKKIISLLIILFFLQSNSFSQNQIRIDSLELQLKNHNAIKFEIYKNAHTLYDTTKANILFELSTTYRSNDPAKSIEYANQSLVLSQQIGYKKGIGNAYFTIGVSYTLKGDYVQALDFFDKSLNIRTEIDDKIGMATARNGIGLVYYSLGNYPLSLQNHLVALKIREDINDKNGIAASYNNIGIVYIMQKSYDQALKYFFDALAINQLTGNKQYQSVNLGNIGEIYTYQGNFDEAIKHEIASINIFKEIGDEFSQTEAYLILGKAYEGQENYSQALKSYIAALKISQEQDDKEGQARSNMSIGTVYVRLREYKPASEFLGKGLALAKEVGSLETIKKCYEALSSIDSSRGNHKEALDHYKQFITYRDSLLNYENTKKITQQQMQYNFDIKETLIKAESEKKLQQQKLVRNGFIAGFSVVLLFAGVFFTQRNKIKKSKKRSDELLLNILPEEVAEELKTKGSADAKQFDEVTVMFTDFKNFTQISEKLSPRELVAEIHSCFKEFDNIISKHNIEKIKTIGDAYMCAGGLPIANKTNAADVVKAAIEIQQFMQQHLQQRKNENKEPFEIRIGIHTGPVVAGIVGVKKFAYDIWGDTVNIASRMESSSEAGKVNISGSTYKLVKDLPAGQAGKFHCIHRGKIQAKNKGEIDMYFVEAVQGTSSTNT